MDDLPTILAELRTSGAAAVATADRIRQTAYALAPDLPPHTSSQEPADLDAIRDRLLLLLAEAE